MIVTLYSLAWGIGCLVAAFMVIWCGITRCRACGSWCEDSQECAQIRIRKALDQIMAGKAPGWKISKTKDHIPTNKNNS